MNLQPLISSEDFNCRNEDNRSDVQLNTYVTEHISKFNNFQCEISGSYDKEFRIGLFAGSNRYVGVNHS
jgi:hypothetical protein